EGEVEQAVDDGGFETYAEQNSIPRARVELNAGDLYFFYTENIHKVPKAIRSETRVVLAVFIGMSPEDEEIFVWS
ncbi:MAG TPA: 2OG-Fe(II) oxygenase family protein, partial [Candidatus Latescibacteria bacterium]|nr:2OG-Fe(II) oxygenase family protein [Candidatus Latescibacterota bacterium]